MKIIIALTLSRIDPSDQIDSDIQNPILFDLQVPDKGLDDAN